MGDAFVLSFLEKGGHLFSRVVDLKVVSTQMMIRNGASVSADFLEKSIITRAPFGTIFFWNILEYS